MASTHKSLRSSTANKRPTTAIADGQIALNTNTTSPGLFFKDSTGATIIKVGPVHIGTTAPNATPPSGGSSGNSTGEVWLDTSLTPNGVKIWDGSAWVNATPIGSTTVQGLLELATDTETQTGSDTARAVTPAGLQSKLSDSTSTTSSTTIASSTAVKAAYDLANAALPKSGGTVTGNLEIGTTGSLSFEGATADAFETTIAVTDPTADRTITLPDTTGTVVTTGDTGTVTSTMIADGTIVNADINASAAIAYSKLAALTSANILVGNASNVATSTAVTGDVTISNAGVTAISSGVIVDADINASAAIADTKLAQITTASKVSGTALTGTIPSAVLGNSSTFVGTTSIALNRSSANQALTGISSVALPGSTSGTVTVQPTAVAGTTTITLPATTGTVVTTGDSGTVTSTMIADGTIVNADINASAAIAGTKVSPDFGSQNTTTTGTSTAASFIPSSSTAPTNGLYLPAANSVAISTGGSGRLFVDSSGRIVIGASTAAIGNPLEIVGNPTGLVLGVRGRSSDNIGIIGFYPNASATEYCRIQSNGDSSLSFGTGSSGTERLRITSGGLVGIGNSSPGSFNSVANNLVIGSGSGSAGTTISTGATSTGYLAFCGTGNTTNQGWVGYAQTDNRLEFGAASAARMHLTSTGLGIGTTSPTRLLHLSAADSTAYSSSDFDQTYNFLRIVNTTGAKAAGIYFGSGSTGEAAITAVETSAGSTSLTFGTRGGGARAERARIDESGRLLLGTSSSPTVGDAQYGLFRIQGNTSSASGFGLLSIGRGQAAASISSGSELGHIHFTANDGSPYAVISGYSDAAGGSGDYPGRLVFSTTADGASSPTERMRITNSGYAKFTNTGTVNSTTSAIHEFTSSNNERVLGVWNTSSTLSATINGLYISYSNASPNSLGAYYIYCDDSVAQRFGVRSNGGVVNYSANNVNLSDRNVKKDIAPAAGTWECLKEWEIVNFRYKDQPDDADLNMGVIAQQVAESCPEVIQVFQEAKEATETEPAKEERIGVKEQQMMWMAIKALQEAQVRIEELEAKVAALEAS